MILFFKIKLHLASWSPPSPPNKISGYAPDFNSFLVRVITWVKVKVKFTLEQATKAQRGSRGIAVLFLQPRR